ncbi:hypothetical protein GUJ93_ZPchr0011g28515 [Zizania palustris]|uniref:Uncharacterized protein n=1 Tax=Zizania palustris TaxID=103762 RepID=A0A8J6BLV2_ZIZPA|nr:hypothetical protein GUJ93_ZPchr0011g28515 [Zizania palustris]
MEIAELNRAQAIAGGETEPKFELSFDEKAIGHRQLHRSQDGKICHPAEEEKCDLELRLATGSSSGGGTRSQKGKRVKSSNSDSGTAVSSTSTEPELAELKEFDATAAAARFQSESKKRLELVVVADEMNLQPPWINQCLSLRTT